MDRPSEPDLATNHAWWEERAPRHLGTPMYRRFLRILEEGGAPLYPYERGLAGDVQGRDLLHLQCHVGTDTLGWVRLGARVTGVDFSPAALTEARALSTRLNLPARWIEADVRALPPDLDGRFDLVVTTYGTFGWLPSLDGWAEGIRRALRPGGRLVLVDGHPVALGLDEEASLQGELRLRYPVHGGGRLVIPSPGSYADRSLETRANEEVGWAWGIGDVVGALTRQGLLIDHLAEHDRAPWQVLPGCVEEHHGLWRLPDSLAGRVPLLFSLRALAPVS